ncbi:MAG: DUF2670 domain-containing protein [Rickettsiaceae bacterium]|nr:DUF2670 domain-containing protein [Rickettsiaceae bacterium]
MFAAFLSKLKVLLQNPVVVLVYGILSKWYIMVVITSVMVTFWVLKGLTDAGVMEIAENTVFNAFRDTKAVAQHCTPKILNLGDFWECLKNPPTYEKSKDEEKLESGLDDLLNFNKYDESKDPYADKSAGETSQ